MRLAVVGSRSIREYDLAPLIPEGVTEIISGGAAGVDKLAERYAGDHNLKLTVFLPQYGVYGRRAPLLRDNKSPGNAMPFWLCGMETPPARCIP